MEPIGLGELLLAGLVVLALLHHAGDHVSEQEQRGVILEELMEALGLRGERPSADASVNGALFGLVIFVVLVVLLTAVAPGIVEGGFP